MSTITSPTPGHNGTTMLGPYELEFKDGRATVDGTLNEGARAYLLAQGYGVDDLPAAEPAATTAPQVDARDAAGPEQVGTALRDAAVDPQPGDFLPPTNAGQADPHGPDVVAPGIHAEQGVRPVKAGQVHVGDPAEQGKAETEHAEDATDGTPVVDDVEQPPDAGSPDAWRDYALARGADQDAVRDLTRDQLREQYGSTPAT